jgi:hypothetical protein
MTTTAFTVVTPHIDDLPDSDIDALLDLYLFGFEAWCHERCLVTPDNAIAVCIVCGYTEELRLAGPHFNIADPHPRRVPRYTEKDKVWRVIEQVKKLDVQAKIRFELALQRLYHCNILSLTARMVGIAALQAINVIDDSGYVIDKTDDEARP